MEGKEKGKRERWGRGKGADRRDVYLGTDEAWKMVYAFIEAYISELGSDIAGARDGIGVNRLDTAIKAR